MNFEIPDGTPCQLKKFIPSDSCFVLEKPCSLLESQKSLTLCAWENLGGRVDFKVGFH